MRKISILMLVTLLFISFQNVPQSVFAESSESVEKREEVRLVAEEPGQEIEVYEDENGAIPVAVISDNSTVERIVNDEEKEYIYIIYKDPNDTNQVIEGFVNHVFVQSINEEVDELNQEVVEETDSDIDLQDEEENIDEEAESIKDEANDEQELTEQELESTSPSDAIQTKSAKRQSGIALKANTNVYEEKSISSNVLKSYPQGHVLIFNTHEPNWYIATVYKNGVPHTGYIYSEDVDVIFDSQQETKQGNALNKTVSVYERPSKDAKALKSYQYGHILKYRTYSSQWHMATVIVNGERQTGFIHADDIGPKVQGVDVGKVLNGVGLSIPTNVYESTSRNSKVLRSYQQGHLLKFREYSGEWYEATVILKGVRHTGYINKNDVGTPGASLNGLAQKAPTHVYGDTNRSSSVLKSYAAGHKLIYRPFNSEWYQATVYIQGKAHTGYIHASDVGNSMPTLSGYALKGSTHVYSQTTKQSNILKSYRAGHLLKYQAYDANWYKAVVIMNGQRVTGYIHRNDVGILPPGKTVIIDAGHGGRDPGTSGNGIVEKTLVLELAQQTKRQLEANGINVIMTRDSDTFYELAERSQKANASNANLFLSIHANAFNGSASGIETYWYDKYASAESQRLASAIQQEVIKETNGRNRGVKKGNFHVIRETKIPSALLEVGFIDNEQEAAKLKQASYKQSVVNGIVNGIKLFLS